MTDVKPIEDYNKFKHLFSSKLKKTLDQNLAFKHLLYELLVDNTAYVIGGYLRDIVYEKESRDIDIIVSSSHYNLIKAVKGSNIDYSINRHNGIKLHLGSFDVDIWSIQNNWAFCSEVVKMNDNDMLESIANGCFYNYDALVINVQNRNMNVRHYNSWARNRTLDIIQKNSIYKKENPTTGANILRALYIHLKYGVELSDNCKNYIKYNLGKIEYTHGEALGGLTEYMLKYPKYSEILDESGMGSILVRYLDELKESQKHPYLDLYDFKM